MDPPSLSGRLLVALPTLGDPNFERTVVLLLEHGVEGALGLVLNRPTEVGLERELPAWTPLTAPHPVFFVGGPVAPSSAIALGRVADPTGVGDAEGWRPVLGPVGTVDLGLDPRQVRPAVGVLRVFAGHAGWSAGQLEGEIAEGSWLVVDGEVEDVFTDEPARLWRAVLRRQPGRVGWLANYPPDVSVN